MVNSYSDSAKNFPLRGEWRVVLIVAFPFGEWCVKPIVAFPFGKWCVTPTVAFPFGESGA